MLNKPFDLKHALEHEHLLPPWWSVANEEEQLKQFIIDELQKEVSSTHPLYGKTVRLLARGATDDCLFEIIDSKKVAWVHLTWKGSTEIYDYPITIVYDNLHQWYKSKYIPDFLDALSVPNNLTPLQELVIGPAFGFVTVKTVENYIYELDLQLNNLTEDEYLYLISIDFHSSIDMVLRALNSWYIKKLPKVRLDLNEIKKMYNSKT